MIDLSLTLQSLLSMYFNGLVKTYIFLLFLLRVKTSFALSVWAIIPEAKGYEIIRINLLKIFCLRNGLLLSDIITGILLTLHATIERGLNTSPKDITIEGLMFFIFLVSNCNILILL